MARLRCYSLLLGARNTPAAGKTFTPADDALIREITFRHFPEGFTVLEAQGGWFDPAARRFIAEASRQILVCAANPRVLRPWCRELATALNQEALLVVEHGAATAFRFRPGAARRGKADGALGKKPG